MTLVTSYATLLWCDCTGTACTTTAASTTAATTARIIDSLLIAWEGHCYVSATVQIIRGRSAARRESDHGLLRVVCHGGSRYSAAFNQLGGFDVPSEESTPPRGPGCRSRGPVRGPRVFRSRPRAGTGRKRHGVRRRAAHRGRRTGSD